MLTLLAALVAVGCCVASARRLALVVAPTSLEPTMLLDALSREDARTWIAMRDGLVALHIPWESDVLAAFALESKAEREAALDEQMLELQWRAQRLSRVPRVCASIATSAGFLFACVAVLQGLSDAEPDTTRTLMTALDSLTVGIAGMSFCAAVHLRARHVVRERLAAIERLIGRLRLLAGDLSP
jgi:hypothetical protein